MNEDLNPEFLEGKIVPFYNINNFDLDQITQVLVEQTRKAESVQEVKEIVSLLPFVEEAKGVRIKNGLDIIKIEEAQKQTDFNRRMAERKELVKIAASIAALGIGVYLMPTAPLFAPLVIILGIASPLQYSLTEVANLWERMINSTKNVASDLLPPDDAIKNQSDNIDNEPGKL